MRKNYIKRLALGGAALTLAATGAFAQTSNSSTVNTNQTPTAIGVTPQTAREANQKAIQRSDTGTVVRTDATAAEHARDAANRVQNNATSSTMDNNIDRTAVGTAAQRRAARADRN